MTIAVDWLGKRARLTPTKIALIDATSGDRIDYRSWDAQANRTARLLGEGLGIGKGERVAVLASNSVAYLDLVFACNKTGSVLQNLNWRLAAPELEAQINHAQPRALFYSADQAETVQRLRRRRGLTSVRRFVALDATIDDRDLALSARDAFPPEPPPWPGLTLHDPWVICYTGGSTGEPRGVISTYGNLHWNAVNTVMGWGLHADDVTVLDASLAHTGGLNVLTTPLVHLGGTSVVCSGFDPETTLDWLASGAISIYFAVPTMLIALQNHEHWAEADLSGLRFAISGGAPCPDSVFQRFWDKGVEFRSGYGLTEAGPNNFWLPGGELRQKPGAVGYPLFHVELRLVDTNGGEVTGPGTPGELLIRGSHRTPGYWNNPVATGAAIDDEGWLHTRDLAVYDDDGAYTICGRASEVFISGGENVYPGEVETAIYDYPAVLEAAVIERPDPTWGEVGVALVVPRRGQQVSDAELTAFLRERLAAFKLPKVIRFIAALPRTASGKVDRRALRERYGPLR